MTTQTKSKPAETIRVGSVKIAIWKNQGKDGPYFTAGAPEVSYRKDGKWHTARSLGKSDLSNISQAAQQAHAMIVRLSLAAAPAEAPAA